MEEEDEYVCMGSYGKASKFKTQGTSRALNKPQQAPAKIIKRSPINAVIDNK